MPKLSTSKALDGFVEEMGGYISGLLYREFGPMTDDTPVDIPLSFKSPESNSVEEASYDPATMTLTVTLKPGKVYRYQNISQELWLEFETASSKGRFFSQRIRPLFIGKRQ